MFVQFRDRAEAGRLLARALDAYAGCSDLFVFGLPLGGVPVAFEVARALNAPLDVLPVRKLALPGYEDPPMGAIAPAGVCVLNIDVVHALRVSRRVVAHVAALEQREMERRERIDRAGRPRPDVRGRTVIVVDDGMATGASMRAAVGSVSRLGAARIVAAVPTAAPAALERVRRESDECICLTARDPSRRVGDSYEIYPRVTDRDVRDLLGRAVADPAPLSR